MLVAPTTRLLQFVAVVPGLVAVPAMPGYISFQLIPGVDGAFLTFPVAIRMSLRNPRSNKHSTRKHDGENKTAYEFTHKCCLLARREAKQIALFPPAHENSDAGPAPEVRRRPAYSKNNLSGAI
jgi:hypothetical protein